MSTVLITGANRGLGLEFSRQYSKAGWKVLACCRAPSPELEELAAAADNVHIHKLDVSDHASIEALADELGDEPIDVLLNNAGMYGSVSFPEGGR